MQTALTMDLKSQIESLRRLSMTPLDICHRLNLDPIDDLAMVARVCELMPRRYGVGLQCAEDKASTPQYLRRRR